MIPDHGGRETFKVKRRFVLAPSRFSCPAPLWFWAVGGKREKQLPIQWAQGRVCHSHT